MYIFCDEYSEECRLLEDILKAIKADYTFVVEKDHYFLPDQYVSLMEHVMGRYEDAVYEEKALDFGFVDVPCFWQVRAEYGVANVYDMGKKKAVMHSCQFHAKRVVTTVEWLSETGQVYRTDYYNKYGFACCKVWKDLMGKSIMKSFYTKTGKEVISYDLQREFIYISQDGPYKKYFNSEKELLKDVLKELIEAGETIVITSVSQARLLKEIDPEGIASVIAVFDRAEDLKAYRELYATGRKYPVFMLSNSHTAYMQMQENEFCLCYAPNVSDLSKKAKRALIVTTTDQLIGVEELITGVPEITFDIAANTQVSEKIKRLEQYSNVRVHACIDETQMKTLMEEAAFYLDINNGRELFEVIRKAAMEELLILGQEATMHNSQYVLSECYFKEDSLEDMITMLRKLQKDEQLYNQYVKKQKQKSIDTLKEFARRLGIKEETYGYLCV